MTRKYLLAMLLFLAACGSSPENHYYTLSAESEQGPQTHLALNRVAIPTLLDRPQIVMGAERNEVTLLEYHRWAEPFDSMIQRVLAEDLHASIATTQTHGRRLQIRIDQFQADAQGSVSLRASWSLQDKQNNWHHFDQSESVDPSDISAIVASMSHLLAMFAQSITSQMGNA